jgi:hypothetical protein
MALLEQKEFATARKSCAQKIARKRSGFCRRPERFRVFSLPAMGRALVISETFLR